MLKDVLIKAKSGGTLVSAKGRKIDNGRAMIANRANLSKFHPGRHISRRFHPACGPVGLCSPD